MIREHEVLTLVLAGGCGERLYPLTAKRCKPAVPFGGSFCVIDFTLINCVLSGLSKAYLLTQYLAESLARHIRTAWNNAGNGIQIRLLPPPSAAQPYLGTADAVYKNAGLLAGEQPRDVLILSGDHVYRADYRRLTEFHRRHGADVTILTGTVEAEQASCFGVVEVSGAGRITGFVEKPADPTSYAKDGKCSINLGIYCFRTPFLLDHLSRDALEHGQHDFGRDILPAAVRNGRVLSCELNHVSPDPEPYWRDVGTVDSFFRASMDLLGRRPAFPLASSQWAKEPWLQARLPRLVAATACLGGRRIRGFNLLASGARISDAAVVNSILSPGAQVEKGAELEECILFPGARVEEGARLRRVIVEEGMSVPPGAEIGVEPSPPGSTGSQPGVTVVFESMYSRVPGSAFTRTAGRRRTARASTGSGTAVSPEAQDKNQLDEEIDENPVPERFAAASCNLPRAGEEAAGDR